jgi:acetolactate decarboxylase
VQTALAEALDIDHHSLFQVSTSGAIVQGLYQGCVSVADLRRHGDVGLGTFENLDGEMILLDGHCYQARSDGTVIEAADSELTPFASVVNFAADREATLNDVQSLDDCTSAIDSLRTSENGIVSFRAHGRFQSLLLRAACKTESGVDLVEATSAQAEFSFSNIAGTLVGFWSPDFTKSISISGYHLHFISDDRSHGGHVLGLRTDELFLEINDVCDVHLAIPETAEFMSADLSGDHQAALNIAEHQRVN